MKDIVNCPYCSNSEHGKYGKYNGNQRYKCKECGKIFTETTKTLMHCSKKLKENIKKFSRLMYENKTLRECAKEMNISIVTAFLWRHKILNILYKSNNKNLLNGLVEAVDYITKENFKGQRKIVTERREKIQIIVPFDTNKRTNPKITSVGTPRLKIVEKTINEILHPMSILYITYNRYMVLVSEKHNKNKKYNYNVIEKFKKDNVLVKIRRWMIRFKGIGSKYIEKYLGWFILDYKLNNLEKSRIYKF